MKNWDSIDQELADRSHDIKHYTTEMGQTYEVASFVPSRSEKNNNFLSLAAKLLFPGFPIQLYHCNI